MLANRTEYHREWRRRNPGKVWAARRRNRNLSYERAWQTKHRFRISYQVWARKIEREFGLTVQDWYIMYWNQGEVCALCYLPERGGKRLSVDHNHRTGKIRSLLCDSCNFRVGRFESDKPWINQISDYLSRYAS